MINETTSAVTCCCTTATRTEAFTFTSVNMMEHLNFWPITGPHSANSTGKSIFYKQTFYSSSAQTTTSKLEQKALY